MPLSASENIKTPWVKDHKLIEDFLHTSFPKGLSSGEAEHRLKINGSNKLESPKKISPLIILVNQFISPFALMLAIAAGLSFFFKDWLDGMAILIVIFVNALIGFLMEFKAERSMEA